MQKREALGLCTQVKLRRAVEGKRASHAADGFKRVTHCATRPGAWAPSLEKKIAYSESCLENLKWLMYKCATRRTTREMSVC